MTKYFVTWPVHQQMTKTISIFLPQNIVFLKFN